MLLRITQCVLGAISMGGCAVIIASFARFRSLRTFAFEQVLNVALADFGVVSGGTITIDEANFSGGTTHASADHSKCCATNPCSPNSKAHCNAHRNADCNTNRRSHCSAYCRTYSKPIGFAN